MFFKNFNFLEMIFPLYFQANLNNAKIKVHSNEKNCGKYGILEILKHLQNSFTKFYLTFFLGGGIVCS